MASTATEVCDSGKRHTLLPSAVSNLPRHLVPKGRDDALVGSPHEHPTCPSRALPKDARLQDGGDPSD